jgi:predicted transposase/invertase (TIGR01784 family)
MKNSPSLNLVPLKNDLVFKLVFTEDPNLLISLLNAVLFPSGENRVEYVQIQNPEILPEMIKSKKSVLDIKAEDSYKRQFHVEVQVGYQALFIKRSIYYLASLIRSQLKESEKYSLLKPVYQINILDFTLFPTDRYMSKYSLRDEHDPNITLTEDLQMVFLELPKFGKTVKEIQTKLDVWLYMFKNAEAIVEEEMSIIVDKEPDMANAFKILEYYASDPEKRQQLEERMNADRDFAYEMVAQFEQGVEEGIEKGIEKKALEDARLMKEYGDPIEKIVKITGLSESQLKENGIL